MSSVGRFMEQSIEMDSPIRSSEPGNAVSEDPLASNQTRIPRCSSESSRPIGPFAKAAASTIPPIPFPVHQRLGIGRTVARVLRGQRRQSQRGTDIRNGVNAAGKAFGPRISRWRRPSLPPFIHVHVVPQEPRSVERRFQADGAGADDRDAGGRVDGHLRIRKRWTIFDATNTVVDSR